MRVDMQHVALLDAASQIPSDPRSYSKLVSQLLQIEVRVSETGDPRCQPLPHEAGWGDIEEFSRHIAPLAQRLAQVLVQRDVATEIAIDEQHPQRRPVGRHRPIQELLPIKEE